MQVFVGVDYHKRWSEVTIMDRSGTELKSGRVTNNKDKLFQFLGDYVVPGRTQAVMEATDNWVVMYDWLEELVGDVRLAHPYKVKLISEARIKTDRIDSRVLAHLLRTHFLPEAYVSSKEAREVRQIVRQRIQLVGMCTMVKNRIRSVLRKYPELMETCPVLDLFSKRGLLWLQGVQLSSVDQGIIDKELRVYTPLDEEICDSGVLIEDIAARDEKVQLLTSIPGIGNFLAVLIRYEIDDISRFRTPGKLCSYCGLVPSTHSSGGKTYHGRITKQGNRYLRWAFVEAVWPAVRVDGELRSFYERLKQEKGTGKAKVAVAKRLATMAYLVLSRKRPYEIRRFSKP